MSCTSIATTRICSSAQAQLCALHLGNGALFRHACVRSRNARTFDVVCEKAGSQRLCHQQLPCFTTGKSSVAHATTANSGAVPRTRTIAHAGAGLTISMLTNRQEDKGQMRRVIFQDRPSTHRHPSQHRARQVCNDFYLLQRRAPSSVEPCSRVMIIKAWRSLAVCRVLLLVHWCVHACTSRLKSEKSENQKSDSRFVIRDSRFISSSVVSSPFTRDQQCEG